MSRLAWVLTGAAVAVILGIAALMVIEDARDELIPQHRRRSELFNPRGAGEMGPRVRGTGVSRR
jgi:hypothetical protein